MKNCLFLIAMIGSNLVGQAKAEVVMGVSVFRDLVSFDSASPGTILSSVPITGLTGQANFESVQGIDFRPATGQLYAFGNAPGNIYRIYTVNTTTGVASQVGADITTFNGTFIGFDFNPVVDRIRVVTDADQNYRFHPDTGALLITDAPLAYAVGDANVGVNPNIVAAAYTNNFAGTATTTLYDIDSSLNILTTQNPPNNGVLNSVGSLGVDFSNTVGFDISGLSGTAFATSADLPNSATNFYNINLATGTATLVGPVGTGLILNDIAAAVTAIPEPSTTGLLLLAGGLCVARRRKARSK